MNLIHLIYFDNLITTPALTDNAESVLFVSKVIGAE